MKHILVLISILMSAISMSAYYKSVEFTYTGGGTLQIESNGLVVTVDGENLIISNSTGENIQMDASRLLTMQFIDEVDDPDPEDPDTGISVVDFKNTEVSVYSLAGMRYGNFSNIDEARDTLSNGVYVLKTKSGATFKIVVKK